MRNLTNNELLELFTVLNMKPEKKSRGICDNYIKKLSVKPLQHKAHKLMIECCEKLNMFSGAWDFPIADPDDFNKKPNYRTRGNSVKIFEHTANKWKYSDDYGNARHRVRKLMLAKVTEELISRKEIMLKPISTGQLRRIVEIFECEPHRDDLGICHVYIHQTFNLATFRERELIEGILTALMVNCCIKLKVYSGSPKYPIKPILSDPVSEFITASNNKSTWSKWTFYGRRRNKVLNLMREELRKELERRES